MYTYAVNNPLFYVDPEGRDAIAVGLSKQVPVFGHAGSATVHRDGSATYARFGPKQAGTFAGTGTVTPYALPKVEFDQTGIPTAASFAALTKAIAGFEKQDPSTLTLVYFKTSETETNAQEAFYQSFKGDDHYGDYCAPLRNCADFLYESLIRGGAIQSILNAGPISGTTNSGIPNILIWQLMSAGDATYQSSSGVKKKKKETKEDVKSKIVYGTPIIPQ